jgi:protein phosphatase PTC7
MVYKLRPLLLHRCWSRKIQTVRSPYLKLAYSQLRTSATSTFTTTSRRCFSSDVGAYFRHKTVLIPHDSKLHRGGEDAAATSDTILVVADGVGGWAQENVNPGLYSSLLTKTIVELFEEKQQTSSTSSLTEVVHDANWIAAKAHLGSATCTTLAISSPTTLSTVNVGDSGYALFRVVQAAQNPNSGEKQPTTRTIQLVYETKPGQVRFNFPHQLGGEYGDAVKDVGVEATHAFEHGDLVVVFSDGVSDNMNVKEFLPIIDQYLNEDATRIVASVGDGDDKIKMDELFMSYSLVADGIARKAYALGKDDNFDSPFAKGARAAGWGDSYRGGKDDDITVTVAQVFVGAKPALDEKDTQDPHYSESIYLYTGPIPPVSELPTKEQLLSYIVRDNIQGSKS